MGIAPPKSNKFLSTHDSMMYIYHAVPCNRPSNLFRAIVCFYSKISTSQTVVVSRLKISLFSVWVRALIITSITHTISYK